MRVSIFAAWAIGDLQICKGHASEAKNMQHGIWREMKSWYHLPISMSTLHCACINSEPRVLLAVVQEAIKALLLMQFSRFRRNDHALGDPLLLGFCLLKPFPFVIIQCSLNASSRPYKPSSNERCSTMPAGRCIDAQHRVLVCQKILVYYIGGNRKHSDLSESRSRPDCASKPWQISVTLDILMRLPSEFLWFARAGDSFLLDLRGLSVSLRLCHQRSVSLPGRGADCKEQQVVPRSTRYNASILGDMTPSSQTGVLKRRASSGGSVWLQQCTGNWRSRSVKHD